MLFMCKLMLNEVLILQILSLIILFFFCNVVNILNLWYLAGLYFVSLGFLMYLDDGDIFIGFLWLIDLGVGLIFFIFIVHFSSFLFQKANVNLNIKFFIYVIGFLIISFFFFFVFLNPVDLNFTSKLKKIWFFLLIWYDYYNFFFCYTITDLNLMRNMYFYTNSFEFFLINFMLFYGIINAICLTFLIKKIFAHLYFNELNNMNLLNNINSIFFIRNQNFINQQNTFAGVRAWLKKKKN